MKALTLFLFVCLSGITFAEQEYLDHPPQAKRRRAIWRGDRRIVRDQLQLWLDWPMTPVMSASEGKTREVEARLHLKGQGGEEIADWPHTLRVTGSGVVVGRTTVFSLPLPQELKDGAYTLSIKADGFSADALPAPLPLRKVRSALYQVAGKDRDEIASWILEANHERLIWGKQPLWPNLDKALLNPEAPYEGLKGFLIRSYENRHLRRRQPYTVYVPESLDLSRPAPLMILLHGSGGDYRNLVADYAAGQRFEEFPMLIANAGAFRNTEFRHMVLEDVRGIIEDMKRKYNVDPNRIYAQGISLGGRGVLELSALMPDTFAAVSSQGTYGVHHEWMDPLFPLHRDPVAFQLAARSDIRTWMPNLATTPVEMAFGWNDISTRPVGALAIAIQLQRMRYKVVERGFDSGHNITLPEYDWASTRKWFLEHEKERWPRKLRLRVANLRHNRFSWVRVDALHDPSAIGEVEAFVSAGSPRFKVRNVARLTVIPPPEEAGFTLEPKTYGFDENGVLLEEPPDVGAHTGPIWDIFSEPVILVVDPTVKEIPASSLMRIAQSHSRTDATPTFTFPVRRGDEMTPEEAAAHNLILYTTSNSQWAWREKFSIPLPPEVADLRKEADTLMAIRPSPWSSRHKVLILECGLNQRTVASPYRAGLFQEPLQADWVLFGPSRRIKAGGSFHADGRPGPWTPTSFTTRVITR